jgi:sulfate transport system permease protein
MKPETRLAARPGQLRRAQQDPWPVRWGLTAAALGAVGVLVVIPVVHVFAQALADGLGAYGRNLVADPDTRHAILLTLIVAPTAVVANLVFGVAAAWVIARFRFPGRVVLTTLIDLPFSVSPVVAGLIFVLIFGLQGYLGPWMRDHGFRVVPYLVSFVGAGLAFVALSAWRGRSDPRPRGRGVRLPSFLVPLAGAAVVFLALVGLQEALGLWPRDRGLKIIFATPGLILATSFVTLPFVARELIPVMEAIGAEEELAALTLGASGWQMFWRVTLPNIKWGLLYGLILCNARAMGEFGAVYVVSGHIAGQTDTVPLRVEKLFQEYNTPGSFAVASLLTLLALVTLVVKTLLERRGIAAAVETAPAELQGRPGTPGFGPPELVKTTGNWDFADRP